MASEVMFPQSTQSAWTAPNSCVYVQSGNGQIERPDFLSTKCPGITAEPFRCVLIIYTFVPVLAQDSASRVHGLQDPIQLSMHGPL
jgi:hypothetical protein